MTNRNHSLTRKLLVSLLVGLGFWIGCTKPSNETFFDITPRIELLSLSTTELMEFTDTLKLVLKYEDGDGDLGNSNPDINSLFVKDSRLENADEYYVGPLAPENANISITGTLNVNLSTTFLLGNGSEETAIYTIYMIDRSGNQSNSIETEPIVISRN